MRTRFCFAVFLCISPTVHSLWMYQTSEQPVDYTTTLRQWMSTNQGLNVAIAPQYNNQHTVFGVMEALKDTNLMSMVKGISTSGSALPAAYHAAGLSFNDFDQHFPKQGWRGFGPQEPKIEMDYRSFLKKSQLPDTFEKLQTPLAVTLTNWDDVKHIKNLDAKHARPLILTSGDLHSAIVGAAATGGQGLLTDPFCPHCLTGFHPKNVQSQYPVTNGAFADQWGTKGVSALPGCSRLLHILPLDYNGQVEPQSPRDIAGHPLEMVTLMAIQPPSATQSAQNDAFHRRDITHRRATDWNRMMFEGTYKAVTDLLDQKMRMEGVDGSLHAKVLADGGLDRMETPTERSFDEQFARGRDLFWNKFGKTN